MSKTREQSNGKALSSAMLDRQPVADGVGRLLAVIDDAVANLSTKGERELVREGIASVVKETLVELAEEQASQRALAALPSRAIGDAAQAGMNVAKQVKDLGFVEFTTSLVSGVFDTIVTATIKQMDAYAKLVADLAKTLAQFQAENVSDAQINEHLAERYPDGVGGTVVRSSFTFEATAAAEGQSAKTATEKLQDVVNALISETSSLRPPAKPLTRESDSLNIAADATATKFTDEQTRVIRPAIGALLATSMMDHLRAMAREGMARIVITNGEIMTRLTFSVNASEIDTRRKTDYSRHDAGAYIRGSGGFLFGRVSAGASWNHVRVNTVNETNFDSLTMSTEIIGQVKINFKTETFPAIVTEGGG
jgi:hypothetical protein